MHETDFKLRKDKKNARQSLKKMPDNLKNMLDNSKNLADREYLAVFIVKAVSSFGDNTRHTRNMIGYWSSKIIISLLTKLDSYHWSRV